MEIKTCVENQRTYFKTHATLSYAFRYEALTLLQRVIRDHELEIMEALKQDLGKSNFESYMSEIGIVLEELNYAKKHLKQWMKPQRVPTPLAQFPAVSFTLAEPYGVALIMAPWNYPFQLTLSPLIGAIAAGNCAIVKPSAYAPATSHLIAELLGTIYDENYIAVIEGGREENSELLQQRFDTIFFTGGVQVGRLVMEQAAKWLTPVTLELGGKSPCLVDASADIQLAARRIIFGKLLNAGQTCVAPDYILVDQRVKAPLIEALRSEIHRQYGTNPTLNENYPRIINEKHEQRLSEALAGQPILCGGLWNQHKLMPTLVDEPEPDSILMQEEIFGPILPILSYTHFSEALRFIEQREKPLAAYLFSENQKHQDRFLRECSFGGGCINDTIIHLATSSMPFGGVGQSGMGGYHGLASFNAFSHTKSIVDKSTWMDLPVRYQPVAPWKSKLLRKFMK
ncbi:aldehyde dehydrogenase [Holdemania massiliensis]|uniref:aldehyde dehydrogenase n=1 Tax=Holdemania massiliensis TaxID=1468449 RepID=UPI003521AF33